MGEVIRRGYLERLLSGRDRTDAVKIITGMRRCGKTTLMRQYARHLLDSGVAEENMISINFESRDAAHIEDHSDLLKEIDSRYSGERTYVFLDEVQRVKGWERAVNSLQVDYDADVYVTGSNGYLLSTELSTYISGRYVELPMLPLSFAEFLELHPGNREERFMQYIRTGSLPVVDPDADEAFERDHLNGIYDTVLVRDVLAHSGATDAAILGDVARFLFSNVGNVTSCNRIADALKEDSRKVRRYIDSLQEAYLIRKAERFDIRGKKLLDTLEKYYVTDTGIRNAVLGISSREDTSRQIENIVYLELVRRGYEVAVGKYGDAEVDFTARRGSDVEYYQVTMSMLSDDVYEREVRSLRRIRDSRVKTVLSMDSFLTGLPDGIRHENVISWLLKGR
ncbi:MAG: ATP-binding protein [Candidatus Methanoplasma sp.]|jgi:predicted AAA+ superfamily ATPase|nr:ATP-binding protein [Candidatus Methanoplasma sp.]